MNQGQRIARYRKRRKMSQAFLAKLIERNQGLISRWENNDLEPKMSEVVPLAKALGANPLLLLGYEVDDTTWSAGYRVGLEENTADLRAAAAEIRAILDSRFPEDG